MDSSQFSNDILLDDEFNFPSDQQEWAKLMKPPSPTLMPESSALRNSPDQKLGRQSLLSKISAEMQSPFSCLQRT